MGRYRTFQLFGGPKEGNIPLVIAGREITTTGPTAVTGTVVSATGYTDGTGAAQIEHPGWPALEWATSGSFTNSLTPLADGEVLTTSSAAYTHVINGGTGGSWSFKTARPVTFFVRNLCYPASPEAQYPLAVTVTATGETGNYSADTAATPLLTPNARAVIYLYSIVGVVSISFFGYEFSAGGTTSASGTGSTFPAHNFASLPETFIPPLNAVTFAYVGISISEVGGCGSGAGGLGTVPLLGVKHVRGRTGQLHTSRNVTGDLFASRYDDALPTPAVAGSVTLDAGDPDGHQPLRRRGSQILDTVWGSGGAIRLKTSKDRGRTWGATVTIISSGYRNPTAAWDVSKSRLVVVMQKASDLKWYVTVSILGGDGNLGAWSTPVEVATGIGSFAASLTWERDGRFTFVYVNVSSAIAVLRCSKLSNAGVGTWS